MMQCYKCHDTEGPFVIEQRKRRCVCEDCYYLDMAAYYSELYIKNKMQKKKIDPQRMVAYMGIIERQVYDNLQ